MDAWEELAISYPSTDSLDAWGLINNLLFVTVVGDSHILVTEDTAEVLSEVFTEELVIDVLDSSSTVSEGTSELLINVLVEQVK